MSNEQVPSTKQEKVSQKEKPVKAQEERLKESMYLLQQLRELGIAQTEPGYKELSGKLNDWIKGGPSWSGTIDFHRFNRRARVILPTRPGVVSTCQLQNYVF
jgi:hypothetical protein